jgi:hypothetical protein
MVSMNQGVRGTVRISVVGRRSVRRGVIALALVIGGGVCAVPPLAARDVEDMRLASDLRTPKGWEQGTPQAPTKPFRPVRLTDLELIVPAAWTAPPVRVAGAGGRVCSELVVPEAWQKPRASATTP